MSIKIEVGKINLEAWCKENNRQDLISEWDTEKNNNKPMSEYGKSSHLKVWWKCSKCSHSLLLRINARNKKTGITSCSNCKGN